MSLSSQTIPLWAWYHQDAASGHEITSSQRGATQGKGWQGVESIHGLYFMRWSQRDCRRWCADPPLGRALQKPQQFGKKGGKNLLWSITSHRAWWSPCHSVSPKKYSEKLKCDKERDTQELHTWPPKQQFLKNRCGCSSMSSALQGLKGTKPLTCRSLAPNPDRFCEWSRVIPICVFK